MKSENRILVPNSNPLRVVASVGITVDGPYCRGCALLRKKFEEDLLTYCVENGIFQDSQDTFESSDDNTNVINALQEPIVVNQDPVVKFSQDTRHSTIAELPQTLPIVHPTCNYEMRISIIYDSKNLILPMIFQVSQPLSQFSFSILKNKLMEQMTSICDMVGQIMQKKEEERQIVEEQATKEDMSIEEMRHE
ncbi:hypothetical protein Tco_1494174 [Tanacetum coccineum]